MESAGTDQRGAKGTWAFFTMASAGRSGRCILACRDVFTLYSKSLAISEWHLNTRIAKNSSQVINSLILGAGSFLIIPLVSI
jgi:hypothetical protein